MTINELISSTLKLRQNINKVNQLDIKFLKFEYINNTNLLVKGLARSKNNNYDLSLNFSDLNISNLRDINHQIRISLKDNKYNYISKINKNKNNVKVRCECDDYRFTWSYFNKQNNSFEGEDFKSYTSKHKKINRNKLSVPGLCKHLFFFINELKIFL